MYAGGCDETDKRKGNGCKEFNGWFAGRCVCTGSPAKADAQQFAIGVQIGTPVYNGYYNGYNDFYARQRYEQIRRQQAFEAQQAYARQQAWAQHEAWERRLTLTAMWLSERP